MHSRRGFTLIELLVVIAIIAILAAILFPVFGKAREKARQTHCTNNQKTFATAVQIYTQEHEETLPVSSTFWGDIRVDKAALKCMTVPSLDNGYVFNNLLSGMGLGEVKRRLGLEADKVFLTGDGKRPTAQVTPGFPETNVAFNFDDFHYRHNGKLIASYLDGHVDMRNEITFEAENTPLYTDYTPPNFSTATTIDALNVPVRYVMDAPCDWTVTILDVSLQASDITMNPTTGKGVALCTFTATKSPAGNGPHLRITATPTRGGGAPISRDITINTTVKIKLASTATASTSWTVRTPDRSYSGIGLSTALTDGADEPTTWPTHNSNANDMWLTNGVVGGSSITYDLGTAGPYNLVGFYMWNYNEAGGTYHLRGVKDATVQVSTDNTTWTTVTATPATFVVANHAAADPGTKYTFAAPSSGRYVRLNISTNHGGDNYVGIAEIVFLRK